MRKRDRIRSGGVIWLTSHRHPRASIMAIRNEISVAVFHEKGKDGFSFKISRRLARMLAKRINQALDASK